MATIGSDIVSEPAPAPQPPLTLETFLAKWDAGEAVWSVELGGLGPGYEQCIQVAAIEMARAGQHYVPLEDKEANTAAWDAICSEAVKAIDEALGGMSGAQYGQARWLAYQWVTSGPEELHERAKKRIAAGDDANTILISKHWPRAA